MLNQSQNLKGDFRVDLGPVFEIFKKMRINDQ